MKKEQLKIPLSGAIDGDIRIPGSKSLSNRAILIAALASGVSVLEGVLESVDTHFMIEAWKKLGISIGQKENCLEIRGASGSFQKFSDPIYIENAGTAARFLTAVLNLGRGRYILTGNARMQERPIKDLLQALNALGCTAVDINKTGCPPVEIKAQGIRGGKISIPGDKSSQYISAVMLAAPYAKNDTLIKLSENQVSKTYLKMTQKIMQQFGVICDWSDPKVISIPGEQCYQGRHYSIEGDASSASYFLGMAAITQGQITINGISPDSTQGDLGLISILEQMGCEIKWQQNRVTLKGNPLKAIEVDMNSMSDVAPTLAMVALFAKGKTVIRNVGNMRIKECDRIDAVTNELKKLGAKVHQWQDGFSIEGGSWVRGAVLETYDDHRMAMSFSLLGLRIPEIEIVDPVCVAKTFPAYFELFFSLLKK
jgi:3-phosphoshikimate 1-carboxyvinyltransferase